MPDGRRRQPRCGPLNPVGRPELQLWLSLLVWLSLPDVSAGPCHVAGCLFAVSQPAHHGPSFVVPPGRARLAPVAAAKSDRGTDTLEGLTRRLRGHFAGAAAAGTVLAAGPGAARRPAGAGAGRLDRRAAAVREAARLIRQSGRGDSAFRLRTLARLRVWQSVPPPPAEDDPGAAEPLQQEAEELLALVAEDIPAYSPSQLTDALLALARLRAADAVFARLLRPEAGVMRAAVQWLSVPSLVADLSASDASWAIWALGRLNCLDATAVAVVGSHLQAPSVLAVLDASGVSRTLWGLAQAEGGVVAPPLPAALLRHALQSGLLPAFRGAVLSTTVWALGVLRHRDEPFLAALMQHILADSAVLASLDLKMVTSLLWGFAQLRVRHEAFVAALADHALRPAPAGGPSPQCLSTLAWALATLRVPHAPALRAIAEEAARPAVLRAFPTHSLAVLLRAYGVLRVRDDALMRGVAEEVLRRMDGEGYYEFFRSLTPRIVTSLMWAYAKVGVRHEPLLRELSEFVLALQLWEEFTAPDVAETLWAAATLRVGHPALLEALVGHLAEDNFLFTFDAPRIAIVAWALARLPGLSPPAAVLRELADRITYGPFLTTFKPRELAITAWAFAKLGLRHRALFTAVQAEALRRGLEGWTAHDITNLIWAFGAIQLRPLRLLAAVLERLSADAVLAGFGPAALSQVAWGLLKLDALEPAFLAALVPSVVHNGSLAAGCAPTTTATLVWVFTALRLPDERFWPAVARCFLDDRHADTLPSREFSIILWGLVRLEVRPAELSAALARRVSSTAFLEQCGPSEVAMVLRSVARLPPAEAALLASLTRRVTRPAFLAQCTATHLADVLAAYAKLPNPSGSGAVLAAVAAAVQEPRVLESFTSRSLRRMWRAVARLARPSTARDCDALRRVLRQRFRWPDIPMNPDESLFRHPSA